MCAAKRRGRLSGGAGGGKGRNSLVRMECRGWGVGRSPFFPVWPSGFFGYGYCIQLLEVWKFVCSDVWRERKRLRVRERPSQNDQ